MKRTIVLFLMGALISCVVYMKPTQSSSAMQNDPSIAERSAMVAQQIVHRSIQDERVIDALTRVKRHCFVPEKLRLVAYEDYPLPIGEGQTISQPYIVALMTELLRPEKTHTILEIGTGSGYQAAVLSVLAHEVYTIELIDVLAQRAQKTLASQGYTNVFVKAGDGFYGWPEHVPFDGIMITAAVDDIPHALINQLKVGGRIVVPQQVQGEGHQMLKVLIKNEHQIVEENAIIPVRFVPFVHE